MPCCSQPPLKLTSPLGNQNPPRLPVHCQPSLCSWPSAGMMFPALAVSCSGSLLCNRMEAWSQTGLPVPRAAFEFTVPQASVAVGGGPSHPGHS